MITISMHIWIQWDKKHTENENKMYLIISTVCVNVCVSRIGQYMGRNEIMSSTDKHRTMNNFMHLVIYNFRFFFLIPIRVANAFFIHLFDSLQNDLIIWKRKKRKLKQKLGASCRCDPNEAREQKQFLWTKKSILVWHLSMACSIEIKQLVELTSIQTHTHTSHTHFFILNSTTYIVHKPKKSYFITTQDI